MITAIINGQIVTPDSIIDQGVVVIDGDRIVACGPGDEVALPEYCEAIDVQGAYILPGFIDIHCHGGGGKFVHEDPDRVAKTHLAHGTTTLLGTLSRMNRTKTRQAIETLLDAQNPVILGINLEGPYLNPDYGARKADSREPDPDEYRWILDRAGDKLKIWTVAPELAHIDPFIEILSQTDVILSVGHTEATARRIVDLIPRGLKLACHIMCGSGLTPRPSGGVRETGVDEVFMLHDDLYAEIIPDSLGLHVRPLMLKLLLKTKGVDKLIIITDAVKDAGVKPITYQTIEENALPDSFAGQEKMPDLSILNVEGKSPIPYADDVHYNSEGVLAGSLLTMDAAVRNMISHTGVSLADAVKMATLNPAILLGIDHELGSIEAGKKANILIADDQLSIHQIFFQGHLVKS